jgi:hypothetical protein
MAVTNGYTTVAALQQRLGIGDVPEGPLEQAINVASRQVDRHCGQIFYSTSSGTVRVYRGTGTRELSTHPFTTTSGLVVKVDLDDDGTYETTWSQSTDWIAHPQNAIDVSGNAVPYDGLLTLSKLWPAPLRHENRVQLTGTFGWTATPPEVSEAALIQAAHIWRRKDTPDGIAGGADFGILRISSRLDPDVKMLLAPFVRAGGLDLPAVG